MPANVVPSIPATALARVTSSSRLAPREGTGSPLPSLWVGAREVENPRAPALARIGDEARHLPDLRVSGRLVACLTHHDPADGGVAR